MLQRILYFILIFSFFSCNKENNDIPSYVKIDDVDLLYNQDFGANTENITDVWFYIDDNLQGVCTVSPVFASYV